MNIKDLPQDSYRVISNPTNINQLPIGSYRVITEEPVAPQKKSLLRSVGDFLTGNEQKFGKDIAQAGFMMSGGQKVLDEISRKHLDAGNQLMSLAKSAIDQNRRIKLLQMAADEFGSAGMTTENIIGEIKSNKQILGDAAGVLLDVLSVGTYSKAGLVGASKLTSGLQKAVPSVVSGVAGGVGKTSVLQGILSGAKTGAKTGVVLGAGYGTVGGLQEDKNAIGIAKSGVSGALGGAVGGAVIGGVAGGLGTAVTNRKEIIANTKNRIDRVRSNMKDILTVDKQINNLKEQAKASPYTNLKLKENIERLRIEKKSSLATETRLNQERMNLLKKAKVTIEEKLKNEAQIQSGAVKEKLIPFFKNVNVIYGQGVRDAEEALVLRGQKIDARNYITDVIEKTIKEMEGRHLPLEQTESGKLLLGMRDELLQWSSSNATQQEMDFNTLKNIKNAFYSNLSAKAKTGTGFGSLDDQVAMSFQKNYGSFIGELSPEIKALNKEFAPLYEARSFMGSKFKPYKLQDIQGGANMLEKLAKGEVPDKTVLNYFDIIEKGTPRVKGIGDLMGKTKQFGTAYKAVTNKKTLATIQENFNLAKYNITSSIDAQIHNVRVKLAENMSKNIGVKQEIERLNALKGLRNKIILYTLGGTVASKLLRISD